jgi:hypothetical protein
MGHTVNDVLGLDRLVFEGWVIFLFAADLFEICRAYKPAITSISTSASFGKRATCTVDRAGGADVKYLA